jgi:hypothetical protein
MLFDLTFPCYLTTFSGKKCLSGKVICAFFAPLIEVLLYNHLLKNISFGCRQTSSPINLQEIGVKFVALEAHFGIPSLLFPSRKPAYNGPRYGFHICNVTQP